jgi:hypothetical protein
MATRVSPAVLPPLKEALSVAFWYRADLRTHLRVCLPNNVLVPQLDWTAYKRNIVRQLVDTMAANQEKYFDDLLTLLLSTAEITDPSYLKKVDGGEEKYRDAVAALTALRKVTEPYRRIRDDAEEADRRREERRAKAEIARAVREKVDELRTEFYAMVSESEQRRGYSLEKFMNALFGVFDIESKGPFRIIGQQIDGAFTFEGTEFLIEAKWQAAKTPTADLMIFASKVRGKLDNTLGLFLSMNGFEDTAVSHGPDGRPVMILMDGSDLSAVLESRIELPELIRRKRQHAARTGETYVSAYVLLG